MSKKSTRHKRRAVSVFSPQRTDRLISPQSIKRSIVIAREQILQGDFEGAINTCEPQLDILPKRSPFRVEVLALLGLSHSMLQHFPESYDIFTEALTLDPDNAELWYNHGLACHFTTRIGQSVRSFERALQLLGTDKGELSQKFAKELESSRKEAQETIEQLGGHFTLDELIAHEEDFQRGLSMMRSSKWKEAEKDFRKLLEKSDHVPQYWGNLGVSLVMQLRYDEAEEALKRALEIDPDYAFARNNLEKLPDVKQAGGPLGVRIRDVADQIDVKQAISFYNPAGEGPPTTYGIIEKDRNTITKYREPIGKLAPRYRFFLNHYKDERFRTCPRCGYNSRLRKFSLFILVAPDHNLVVDKVCRYCFHCELIIAHQDQLEEQLAAHYTRFDPDVISNDYEVIGTLAQDPRKKHKSYNQLPVSELLENLHDFKEVVTYVPAG
jgi:tetratricopeptide (TPR) repeat protein